MKGLYRALLHLYPISFRREYGAELTALFELRTRETGPGLPMVVLWLATIADVIANATAAHWDVLRHDLRYTFRDELSSRSEMMLLALCGASICVLLIACANLANLLIARSLTRRRELDVRLSLGAGRERLVRQLMTERLVIAAAGGAPGIAIAMASVPLLARLGERRALRAARRLAIGRRPALGAQRGQIIGLVVRQGVVLALCGVIPGIALAYAAARAMQSLLFGVEPGDAATFAAAAVLCVLMTLAGSLLPVLRAVRVAPATVFRGE